MTIRSAVLAGGACWLVLGSTTAHAYLDAGSGSMMLQLLLGGLAGVGVAVRLYWRRIADAFGGRRHGPDANAGGGPPASDGEAGDPRA